MGQKFGVLSTNPRTKDWKQLRTRHMHHAILNIKDSGEPLTRVEKD